MSPISVEDRLAGGVWGHLVGDAMGVPYEFTSRGSIGAVEWGRVGSHRQPPGTWSDDGALMLALLDSLLTAGFAPEDQGARAVRWMREGEYAPGEVFDVGVATRSSLNRIAAGTPAPQAGSSNERSNGNGSLMRILPIALVGRSADQQTLFQQASQASAVTHAHPRCRVTCAVYTLLAHRLLSGELDRQHALGAAMEDAKSLLPAEWETDFNVLTEWKARSGDGYVVDCFWSAWDAFAGASTYSETIERAIRYGKDTDTTACVAGGLAGIYWGVGAIPSEWREGMRGREIVAPILDRLLSS